MRAVFLAFTLSALSASAYADFKDAYKDGVRAADDKNWALVESKMREALSLEPNSQPKVRLYGMRFEPYLPHHYLALAASARGNCAAALSAISNSGHVAALALVRDGSALQSVERNIQQRCQSASPVTPPPVTQPPVTQPPVTQQPVTPPIVKPPVPTPPIVTPVAKPPVVQQPVTTTPPPATKPALASTDIASARSAVQTLKRELSAARAAFSKPEIAALSASKSGELAALEGEAARLGNDIERAISALDSASLARALTQARDATSRASKLKLTANSALAAAAPVARPPAPAVLAQLATLYFNGDFKAAAVINVDALTGKALAHALLLRASARYSLFVSQGESNALQLNAVKEDLARAKRTDATVRPNVRFFSPRLIAMY